MNREKKEAKICCFFGSRKANGSPQLKETVIQTIERLITDFNTTVFMFGGRSEFSSLCHSAVTELKEKYPNIKRVYVRAEFPYISDDYIKYLLQNYEDTYFPAEITGSGKAVCAERNRHMIDKSDFCIFCRDKKASAVNKPEADTEGAEEIAYSYAETKKKNIINLLADKVS